MATATVPLALADKEDLSAKFGHWMALYAAFLFLAGWSYLKYYFRVFGVETGWLEFGFNDTLARGFSVLFGAGALLSIVYLSIFLLTLVVEVFFKKRSQIVDGLIPLLLVLLFPVTYGVARNAGIRQANTDRGNSTSLPTIAFTAGSCDYRGKLVYLKGDQFYVFNLAYLSSPAKPASCQLDLAGAPTLIPQLWLVRSSDLKEVRVIHYEREAK
jgi:hypothetical protein